MTLPILYSFRRCPYAMRARMALILANKQVELREILLKNKPNEMLAISSKGTVPVLQLADQVLDESLEIISWAMKINPTNMCSISDDEQLMSNDLIQLFDSKFKHHLDRYKYASRYGTDADIHRDECKTILLSLESLIDPNPWIFGKKISLLDLSILAFIRQYKIANPTWFFEQDFKKVINLLDCFESSALFHLTMEKFEEWNSDDPQVVIFPSESLS
jgi:glutathione S-transferase